MEESRYVARETHANGETVKVSVSEVAIALQFFVIVVLVAWMYSEYSHNQYFQEYVNSFWSSYYQRIVLGILVAVVLLVIIDGVWPVARKQ